MANEKESAEPDKKVNKDEGAKNGAVDKDKDMSEEDKQLQEELTMLVERMQEDDAKLYKPSLEALRSQIRSSTTSMTSVPKPLKFLRPHYATLKECYESKKMDISTKHLFADVISVLGMTMSDSRDCLNFRMKGSQEDIGAWGHEYVRQLQAEITAEWQELEAEDAARLERLLSLALEIVPYHMAHNAEAEACDLLMEIERLDVLEDYVDVSAYPRVCLYLHSCVPYVPEPENLTLLRTAIILYRKFQRVADAMRLALQLGDLHLIKEIFLDPEIDSVMRKQLAFMLGRQQLYLELPEDMDDVDEYNDILSNSHLNNNFLALARELDIMEPKVPEDIYKSHLEPASHSLGGNVDSAKQNLASSFVNGLVNAGFGQDKLLMEDGNKWLYKNKEHGMMSATASLGLVLLWDVDGGLTQIDKYLYSSEDYIKAGALLACGIVNSGVKNECDPALALLTDYVMHNTQIMRIGSIVGLGLAYAGSNREEVIQLLMKVLIDSKASMEVVAMAGLSAGMVAIGTCNDEVTTTILQCLLERSAADMKSTYTRFLVLGLALCYLGKQESAETMLAAVEAAPEPACSMATILIDICAYAGTGNVLKIQQLLHICSEHYEDKSDSDKKEGAKKDDKKEKKEADSAESQGKVAHQGLAVLGIALIAMGEDIGGEMAFRAIGHLLRYGEPVIRRSVPLALALLSTSNPKLNILDTLSKFSHDSDPDVSANSILAMGVVGAGTNNARLGAMLRQLAAYHAKESGSLFMVRLAQGLVHLGKGTQTLCPFHQDRQLMSPTAIGGLLAVLVSGLDVKGVLLGKSHYMLYYLVPAIQPRMLVTFDSDLNPLPVAVRVGQAVDVVGQAGKPKTITGFQTHTTPVLLAYGERAELATEEYLSVTPVMEGFVILKKNPDFDPAE